MWWKSRCCKTRSDGETTQVPLSSQFMCMSPVSLPALLNWGDVHRTHQRSKPGCSKDRRFHLWQWSDSLYFRFIWQKLWSRSSELLLSWWQQRQTHSKELKLRVWKEKTTKTSTLNFLNNYWCGSNGDNCTMLLGYVNKTEFNWTFDSAAELLISTRYKQELQTRKWPDTNKTLTR